MSEQNLTLFDRIGGTETIDKLITAFYQRVLGDPKLSPFFAETSIDKLKRMQVTFFSIALGGPEPEGLNVSLYESHQGRGIKREHLGLFTQHLLETLEDIGVDRDDAVKVYERISTYSNEILGDTTVDG